MSNLNSYSLVDRADLAYEGKLYPADMVIECRAATVKEIREWANVNEKDFMDVHQHILDIIMACTKVSSTIEGKTYSVKDLYECDEIALLLIIHYLTFVDKKKTLTVSGSCTNPSCGADFQTLIVQTKNLTYTKLDERVLAHADHELGGFKFDLENEVIRVKPSTIGIGIAMSAWMRSAFKPNFIKNNQMMFRIIQAMVNDWREVDEKKLRMIQISQYNNLNEEKLAEWTWLVENTTIEFTNELEYQCPQCGHTFRCSLEPTGGVRALFLPVQSIADKFLQ